MKDRTFRSLALAGLTVIFLVLCVLLALPFLPALAWGLAFTIMAWPLHVWLRRRNVSPSWSAFITTFAVLLIVVIPGVFVAYQLVQEAASGAERIKSETVDTTVRASLSQVEDLRGTIEWLDRVNIDVDAQLRQLVGRYTQDAAGLFQGSLWGILQFMLALYILYHFLKDGPGWRDRVRNVLPMRRADCDRVFASASASVHANIYATFLTSLIDAITGGLLFWALGLPSPVLWSVVIFVVSVIPVLGTFLIWVPACVFLVLTKQWLSASILIGWGVVTAVLVDSLLYARLAGGGMRLHQVPAILSFLGGISLFGPSGLILGPAILAVTSAMLDVWRSRAESAGAEQSVDDKTRAIAEVGVLFVPPPTSNPRSGAEPVVV